MISVGAGGLVPNRIPWTAIDRWAERHGVAGQDFDFLVQALGAMDAVLMNHASRGTDGV
jgi:hypothetical protein